VSILVRNIFSNWAGVFANIAVAFLLSPFLVHSLGDHGYGLWVLVLSVTGYMGLLDTGLKVSIIKHVAEKNARQDAKGLNQILFTGLALYGSLSVLVVLLSLIAAAGFPNLFRLPPQDVPTGQVLMVIAALNIALSLPLGVFGGLLAGLQRFDLVNRAGIIVMIVRSAVIVTAVWLGYGLLTLGWIHVASQVLNGIMLVGMARHEFPALQLRHNRLEWASVRALYGYSGFIILNNVAMFLLFYSGEVLIGMFIGTAAVTSYAIAKSLVGYLATVIGSMTQVFHPYASDLHERGNSSGVGRALLIGTRTSLLIALPIGVSFLIIGPAFIGIWMGPEYGRSAGVLLAALTIPQIVWLSQSTAGNVLLGIGGHRFLTFLNLVAGICAIAIGVLLVSRFGALGVALGAAVPIVVSQAVILPVYTTRLLKLRITEYATAAYLVPLAAVIPYSAMLFVISRRWVPGNLYVLALEVAICLAAYLPIAFVAGSNREQRQRLRARFAPRARLADGVQ
jgi:O-antigen/teichoic acid export membrane protein